MRFQVLQDKFAKTLNTASRFATAKAQLPVLGNVLIKTKKNKVIINATNLELSISLSLGAQVFTEGEITIPAKTISEIIGNLPNKPITIEVDKEQVSITSENFSSQIMGMNAADFPVVPESVGKTSITLPVNELVSSLSKVLFSVSLDESRYVLTGVLFIFKKSSLDIVSTDGFRLSRCKLALKESELTETVIIPKSILAELSKLTDEDENVDFSFNKAENQVVFGMQSVVVSSRIIDGEFPEFEKIIPKSSSIEVNVDKQDFAKAIKVSSVFARDSANVVKLNFKKNGIEILADSKSLGNQKSFIDAKIEGGGDVGEVAFNYRFLEEMLSSISSESVGILLTNADTAGVFKDSGDKDYLHLIMPVRIQN